MDLAAGGVRKMMKRKIIVAGLACCALLGYSEQKKPDVPVQNPEPAAQGETQKLGTVAVVEKEAAAYEWYVSSGGNNVNPGTEDQPFKSLAKAVAAARGVAGARTVWIKGGTYMVGKTVELGTVDSGTEQHPLVIRGMPGEEVVFSGGAQIPAAQFGLVTGENHLQRLPEVACGKVWTMRIGGTGLESFFTAPPKSHNRKPYAMLSWNGHLLQQARWPNRGYAYMDKTLEEGPTTRWGWKPVSYDHRKPIGGSFTIRKDGLLPEEAPLDFKMLKREFDRSHDMTAVGYLSIDWRRRFDPIGRINPNDESIQLLGPTEYGINFQQLALERRLYILNTLCHLDEPGEWYYDHADRILYLWPLEEPSATKPFTVVGGPELIKAKGTSHLVLRDITFENFGHCGVDLQNGSHVLVAGCTFRNGIGRGLSLRGGTHNTIAGCDFHDLHMAFALTGIGDNRKTLTPEHNEAVNNHIHHCRTRGYGLLSIAGVGVRFANNLLHSQNGGMFYGDNDAVLEFNEFYDMGFEMGDWNVAYSGADLTKLNNQIRHNFIHHLMETPRGYPVAAFRADDGGSGCCVINNIFYKSGRAAVEFHGPANQIVGNQIMETPQLWGSFQRPYKKMTKEAFLQELREEDEKIRGTYSKEDIIGKAERLLGTAFWTKDSVWTQRYPHLKGIFDLHDLNHNPWLTQFCIVENNVMSGQGHHPIHVHGRNEVKTKEQIMAYFPKTTKLEWPKEFNPSEVFADPQTMNFRFRPDVDLPSGIEPFAFENVGLHLDEYRKSMPDKQAYRLAVKGKYEGVRSNGGAYDREAINRRYPKPAYLE